MKRTLEHNESFPMLRALGYHATGLEFWKITINKREAAVLKRAGEILEKLREEMEAVLPQDGMMSEDGWIAICRAADTLEEIAENPTVEIDTNLV